MKRLTGREEAVMELFWEHGAMFVKDLMEYYPDPKPIKINICTRRTSIFCPHAFSVVPNRKL